MSIKSPNNKNLPEFHSIRYSRRHKRCFEEEAIQKRWIGSSLAVAFLISLCGPAAADSRQASLETHLGRYTWNATPGDSVPIEIEAVVCAPDLLHCRDVGALGQQFLDMSDCRRQLGRMQVGAPEFSRPGNDVIMARCRYSPSILRKPF